MKIRCVWEHKGDDTLLYAVDAPGAFTRGDSLQSALDKMPSEIRAYRKWLGLGNDEEIFPVVVEEKCSELAIRDADSDVLFEDERAPLTEKEYQSLKELALRSAQDFHRLACSAPDWHASALPARTTFYGAVPRTAEEMYLHTRNVNAYYFGEIGVEADNEGTIMECRARGFEMLEQQKNYLENHVFKGSYGEEWSLRKMLRRFLWHDRIHAKALCRMIRKTFPQMEISDPFGFDID